MNRTPLLVGGLFLAIVAAGAYVLGPKLVRRSRKPGTPDVGRTDSAGSRPVSPPGSPPGAGAAPRAAAAPMPPDRAADRPSTALVVTAPDGTPLPAAGGRLLFAGTPDARGLRGSHVRAEGFAWTRVPPTDRDGATRVRVLALGAPLELVVREVDGRPAAGVPVTYGPDGMFARRTDAEGRARIDDMPAGVLRVGVGGGVRTAAPLRVRMGVDRAAEVTLDPAIDLEVRVVDEGGGAVSGADVEVVGFDGPRATTVVTGADGRARVVARLDERLAVFVAKEGYATTAVEPALPDPRRPLASAVEVRLRKESGLLKGDVEFDDLSAGRPIAFRVEPAVLEPLREVLGREDVAERPLAAFPLAAGGAFDVRGLDGETPVRVSLRGPVVPEDHVVSPADPTTRALRFRPDRDLGGGPAGDPPPPPDAVAAHGRVTDVRGAPLAGVTVGAEGRRATTDADGLFVLAGLPKGRPLEFVYGWVDGAETRGVDAAAFSPWFQARATVGDDPLVLVLPKAASATLRLTDGLTGAPLSWARVLVLDGDANVRFDAPVATRGGVAVLAGLVPGTAGTLVALAPGLRREVPIALRAGETVDLGEVGLVRAGRVTGTVKDRKGAPIPFASVAAMEDGRLERGGRGDAYGRDLVLRRATADAEGAFTLEGLDPSRPTAIGVAADGYAPSARRVLWNEGEDATVAATLTRGGSVRLQLLDPAGARVSGAYLELEDARTGVRALDLLRRAALGSFVGSSVDVRRATASFLAEDPALPGVYRLGPVEAGQYELVVSRPGFARKRAKFTVPYVETGAYRALPTDVMDWRLELTPDAK